jgi:hypothetical protein
MKMKLSSVVVMCLLFTATAAMAEYSKRDHDNTLDSPETKRKRLTGPRFQVAKTCVPNRSNVGSSPSQSIDISFSRALLFRADFEDTSHADTTDNLCRRTDSDDPSVPLFAKQFVRTMFLPTLRYFPIG